MTTLELHQFAVELWFRATPIEETPERGDIPDREEVALLRGDIADAVYSLRKRRQNLAATKKYLEENS